MPRARAARFRPLYAEDVTIGGPGAVGPGVNAVSTSLDAPAALSARPGFADVAADHLDAVYRYLVYLTGDRSAAEDLAAETFEKAFRTWRRFDPRRGTPRTWLCRIARTVSHASGRIAKTSPNEPASRTPFTVPRREAQKSADPENRRPGVAAQASR